MRSALEALVSRAQTFFQSISEILYVVQVFLQDDLGIHEGDFLEELELVYL